MNNKYKMHSPKDMLRAPRKVYCRELVALGLDPLCELTTEVWARIEQARDRVEDGETDSPAFAGAALREQERNIKKKD
jgi:hypothetical protein